MSMAKCSNCGAALREGAGFCSGCGQAVVKAVFCRKCGAELEIGDNFCFVCGARVKEPAAEAEQPKRRGRPPKNNAAQVEKPKARRGRPPKSEAGKKEPPKAEKIDWNKIDLSGLDVFDDEREAMEKEEKTEKEEKRVNDAQALPRRRVFNFRSEEEPVAEVPTKEKIARGLYAVSGDYSRIRNGEMEVTRRYNDDVYDDTDPMHFAFKKCEFYKKTEIRPYPKLKGLTELSAYALSDKGVYYAKNGSVEFMSAETGKAEVLGCLDNVLNMSYENGVLTVEVLDRFVQTAYNEHRDLMGYTAEEWVDVYDVLSKKHTFYHNP